MEVCYQRLLVAGNIQSFKINYFVSTDELANVLANVLANKNVGIMLRDPPLLLFFFYNYFLTIPFDLF